MAKGECFSHYGCNRIGTFRVSRTDLGEIPLRILYVKSKDDASVGKGIKL